MATLIVHYIQIHSQGHFGPPTELGKKKKGGDLELQKPYSRRSEKSWNNLLVSGTLGTGFMFVVLLTGPGPRRSQTAALNSVSGGGRRLEAKAKVTRDVTMK